MCTVAATKMAREVIKGVILTSLLIGVATCLKVNEGNAIHGSYISPIIPDANIGTPETQSVAQDAITTPTPSVNVSEPQNLRAVGVSSNMINITWDPPVTGTPKYYTIRWLWSDGFDEATPTSDTKCPITDLVPCTRYVIEVRSSDGTFESAPASVNVTTPSPSVPPPPTNVELTSSDPIKATVSWDMPVRECLFVNYTVTWEWYPHWGDGQDVETGAGSSTSKHYTIRNLTPYSNVTACVSATLEDTDFGDPSCTSGDTMQDSPGPPTIQDVTQDNEFATVKWVPPEILNGVIEKYRVSWKTAESVENSTAVGNVLSCALALQACETYNFSVSAKTAAETWGPPSSETEATILNYLPPEKVSCSSNTDGSVTVSWKTASTECPAPGFHAEYNWTSLWSQDHGSNSQNLDPDNMELEVLDLLPYSQLHACVGVGDKLDNGGCCTINTAQEVPGPVADLTFEVITESEANITWAEPIEINGVLGTWLLSLSVEDEEVLNVTLPPETRSYVPKDLLLDTDYNVTIQASTEAGFGDPAFLILSTTSPVEINEPNLALIIGGSVGLFIGIVIIVVAVIFGWKWKTNKTKRRQEDNRRARQTQTPEKNEHKTNTDEVSYGSKSFPNTHEKQNSRRDSSYGYDNHNFKRSSSDPYDDKESGKPTSYTHDKQNFPRPISEVYNNPDIRRPSADINVKHDFRRPSTDANEIRNFRRPSVDTDEIKNIRRPSADVNQMKDFRRPSMYDSEIRNFRRPSADIDIRRPSADVNQMKDFRRPSTDATEIRNSRRPSADIDEIKNIRRPSADVNQMKDFRRPSMYDSEMKNFRRPSTDGNKMKDFRRPSTDFSDRNNFRRPSTDVNEMQNFRRPSSDVYDIQNFKRPASHDSDNQYFRKPSPLAYDSRHFRRPEPQPSRGQNFKRPAPQPYGKQNFRRPAPRPYDQHNFRRPSLDFYDNRTSAVSLKRANKDEDVESIDL